MKRCKSLNGKLSERIMPTWAGRSSFSYTGTAKQGTEILYGRANSPILVTGLQYQRLLDHFRGRTVKCGTSRTNRPAGSLGDWLTKNVTKTAVASYVAAVLVNEHYAKRQGDKIVFNE